MKLSIWLIDTLLFLSIFVPYYLFIRTGKNAQKKKLNAIRQISRTHGLSPNIQEYWSDSFIGIDSVGNRLIFIRFENKGETTVVISLDQVSSCNLIRKGKRLKREKGREELLTYLGIELFFNEQGKPPQVLTFYDIDALTGEDYEVTRGEKWLKLIREHLNPGKHRVVAA